MIDPKEVLGNGDALLLVDVQNDFCPGGALPIEEGDQVVPVLNRWIAAAKQKGVPVYASRDWHPPEHISFQGCGGQWPPHCLEESHGASFRADLTLPANVVTITKGVRFDQDQNSAFDQTGFSVRLRSDGVRRLWVGGLALDVCVLATVLDACREGFTVCVIREGTRPVTPEGGRAAIERMRAAGALIVD